MARLEAIAKGLYYPTPSRVIELIADTVRVSAPSGGRLLDVCAGEGTAAAQLAELWGLESYGVELHPERAAACATVMTHALAGSYHQLRTNERMFSVLFLNPPYDAVSSAQGDRTVRQELQFLHDSAKYLASDGLLVFIPPAHILKGDVFRRKMSALFRSIEVYRFPDPEYDAFGQVVVIARRKPFESYYGSMPSSEDDYPVLGETSYGNGGGVTLPRLPSDDPDEPFHFELRGINPYDHAPGVSGGCYRSPQWRLLMASSDVCAFDRPLAKPRPGHVAMLLASGALNGTEISGGQLVKGSSEKITVEGAADAESGTITSSERIVSRLSVLDLTTGEMRKWRTDEDPEGTTAWFAEHGKTLANAVRRDHPPLYNGELGHLDFSCVRAPGVLPGCSEPTILDAQKRAVASVLQCWRGGRKSAVISGEMGVGKTSIAIVAIRLMRFKKTVVICPTHLVKKWMREIDVVTRPGAARTATKIPDVVRFFADDEARVLVISKERAKLGARWEPAVVSRNVSEVREVTTLEDVSDGAYWREEPSVKLVREIVRRPSCPACGALIYISEDEPATAAWLSKVKRKCGECAEQLWQAVPISARGTKRWALAKYINDRYRHSYALVVDEVHQHASASSDQSRAVQLLCAQATHLLAMTGTLYGGRASSIFHLLYKVDPRFRDLYAYTETAKFVQDHGLLETVHKLDEYTSHYGHRRNNSGGRVREIPGVNPAMLNLVLGYTVFLKLKDLGYELPPFEEEVVLLDHDPAVQAAAADMASSVKEVLRKHPKVLGQYLMACLGYPDCPEHAESIVSTPDYGAPEEVGSAPAFPEGLWAKDAAVVKLVKREKRKKRQVLVFFTQTGKRTPIPRVKKHLEAAKLRVAVLDGKIAPDKREEWLRARAGSFDVLLTNGRLVETGLDLLFATTIIQYSTEYSIHTLRQSTRRSWRLGQDLPVKVVYLAYRDTMQEVAVSLIARKMRAAELVDGDDLGGLSQHDEGGHSLLLELARTAAAR